MRGTYQAIIVVEFSKENDSRIGFKKVIMGANVPKMT